MTKSIGFGLVCLILLVSAGCSSGGGGVLVDKIQVVEDQLNSFMPLISGTLQAYNPFNPSPAPSPQLGGTGPACPPQKELDGACNVSGDITCVPSGPDFAFVFDECLREESELGFTTSLIINGSLTYLASEGAGGWPTGLKAINFDGGQLLGVFDYDLTLDGTKDAIIVVVSGTGFTAWCCADLDAELAECFELLCFDQRDLGALPPLHLVDQRAVCLRGRFVQPLDFLESLALRIEGARGRLGGIVQVPALFPRADPVHEAERQQPAECAAQADSHQPARHRSAPAPARSARVREVARSTGRSQRRPGC